MSATLTPTRNAHAQQVGRLTRIYSWAMLRSLTVALAVGIAVSAVLWIVMQVFGLETGTVTITEPDGTSTITTVTFISWFGIPLIAAVISAFVHNIVMGSGYTRVPLATGATRRNLTIANSVATLIGSAVLGILALAGLLLERSLIPEDGDRVFREEWLGTSIPGAVGDILLGTVGMVSVLFFALAVGVLFIRFHWIVGVVALVFLLTVMPALAERFDWGWYAWLTDFGLAQHLIMTVLGAGAYALLMRRVRVP
nr:hypothetical protein [Actinomycetales bacterium]